MSLGETVRGADEDKDRPGELRDEAGRQDQDWQGYIAAERV